MSVQTVTRVLVFFVSSVNFYEEGGINNNDPLAATLGL